LRVVTVTPWGRADELRSRKLRPGPGATREEVQANQRERLFGAMVAAVAEHGYEKTRVADLLELSGISRNTFYRHFSNKQDCFLATVDAIVDVGGKMLVETIAKGGAAQANARWDERLAAGLDLLIGLIVEQPAAARLYYVETYAAGPEAIDKVEQMGDLLEELAKRVLDESHEHA
jgi:AcrR family transcriptional regulator